MCWGDNQDVAQLLKFPLERCQSWRMDTVVIGQKNIQGFQQFPLDGLTLRRKRAVGKWSHLKGSGVNCANHRAPTRSVGRGRSGN
jgi:hypothetical protein